MRGGAGSDTRIVVKWGVRNRVGVVTKSGNCKIGWGGGCVNRGVHNWMSK